MIIEFEQEYLSELYRLGKSTSKKHRFQSTIINGYLKCVKALISATRLEDLFQVKSLNSERLKGDKKGLSSLRINDKYRLEFREQSSDLSGQSTITICSLVEISNHYK